MSLFHAGTQPALDSNGNPISGAVWQFTNFDTTTPLVVYSNASFSSSLGATVESDAAGRFVPIFLDDDFSYRARLWPDDTLTGTPLRDLNGVNGDATSSTRMFSNGRNVGMTADEAATFRRSVGLDYRPALSAPSEGDLKVQGDSISAGFNASSTSERYTTQLSVARGLPETNTADSGDVVADQCNYAFTRVIAADDVNIWALGTNEFLWYSGTDAVQRAKAFLYGEGHLASLLHLGVASGYVNRVTAQAMTTNAGVWTNANAGEDSGAAFTLTQNGEKEGTVSGSTVVVIFRAYDLSQTTGATIQVEIDGVVQGTWETQCETLSGGGSIESDEGNFSVPIPLIFDGLEDREHTVTVTKTDTGGGTAFLYLSEILGFNGEPVEGPVTLAANTYECTDTGYANAGDGAVQARTRQKRVNRIWARNVAIAQRLGLQRTWLWDWAAAIDPAVHLDTDGLHPNNAGHDALTASAEDLLDAMQAGHQQLLPPDVVADAAVPRRGIGPLQGYLIGFTDGRMQAVSANDIQLDPPTANTLTLNTGWTAFAAPYTSPCTYTRSMEGRVYLEGIADPTGSGVALIATLPAGYRPAAQKLFPIANENTYGEVTIAANGQITLVTGIDTKWVALDNISFWAA